MSLKTRVKLPDIVGRGYRTFWNYEGRYRIVKGSRASKKSTTTALNMIYRIMRYPSSNALVVRKTYRTHKDSTFAQLRWAISKLGVANYWRATLNPLELVYIPTGQKILFRGLDDPLKLTSTTVEVGRLCFLWVEEAYEIMKEDDFNMLDESIRGQVENDLFKQLTLTLNPWNEKHWIKRRFFDVKNDNVLAMTTNYTCNEWLDKSDKRLFEDMKVNNPRRYQVAGLGEWGIVEGLIYERWKEQEFNIKELSHLNTAFGLDYGYTNDPTALFCSFVDLKNKKLYVFDEIYQKGMSNEAIASCITEKGFAKEKIVCDSAEPKSNARLRTLGLTRVTRARKGPDSILNGIDFIQGFEILIHPRCSSFITEISSYTWQDDKFGHKINSPIDYNNHLMDAMRYALEEYTINKRIKLFKGGI